MITLSTYRVIFIVLYQHLTLFVAGAVRPRITEIAAEQTRIMNRIDREPVSIVPGKAESLVWWSVFGAYTVLSC